MTNGWRSIRWAVAAYVGAAQDPGEYYRQVLECLIQDRVIDFEAILEASQIPAKDDGPGTGISGDPARPQDRHIARDVDRQAWPERSRRAHLEEDNPAAPEFIEGPFDALAALAYSGHSTRLLFPA